MVVQFKLRDATDFFEVFRDEKIEYIRKTTDFQFIDLQNTSFSKSFTLPASARNNNLFDYYFQIGYDSLFNPNLKNDCEIYMNDNLFATGALRLISIKMKNLVPELYKVQFISDEADIKSILKEFSPFDSKLLHYYTDLSNNNDLVFTNDVSTIEQALNETTVIPVPIEVYPSINSVNERLFFNTTETEGIRVLNSGATVTVNKGLVAEDIRLWLPFKEIMQSLYPSSGLDHNTSNPYMELVTDMPELDELMVFLDNNGEWIEENLKFEYSIKTDTHITEEMTLIFENRISDKLNLFSRMYGVGVLTETGSYTIDINLDTNTEITEYRLIAGTTDTNWVATTSASTSIIQTFTVNNLPDQKTIKFMVRPVSGNSYTIYQGSNIELNSLHTSSSGKMVIDLDLPKQSYVDIIGTVMKMFNATIIKIGTNETYDIPIFNITPRWKYYETGKSVDITKYINTSSMEILPPTFFKNYKMSPKDGNDYGNTKFKESNNRVYGSANYEAGTFFGGDYTYKMNHTTCMFDNLIDSLLYPSIEGTNVPFLSIVDDDGSRVESGLRFAFRESTSDEIYYVDDDGLKTGVSRSISLTNRAQSTFTNISNQNRITNISSFNTNLTFNPEYNWEYQNIYNNASTNSSLNSSTLLTNYHASYIKSIYNSSVRKTKFKINMPYQVMTDIDMNDIMVVDGVDHVIEDIKYSLNNETGTITLLNRKTTETPYYEYTDVPQINTDNYLLSDGDIMTIDKKLNIHNTGGPYHVSIQQNGYEYYRVYFRTGNYEVRFKLYDNLGPYSGVYHTITMTEPLFQDYQVTIEVSGANTIFTVISKGETQSLTLQTRISVAALPLNNTSTVEIREDIYSIDYNGGPIVSAEDRLTKIAGGTLKFKDPFSI